MAISSKSLRKIGATTHAKPRQAGRERSGARVHSACCIAGLILWLAAHCCLAQTAQQLLQQADAALQKNDYAAAATALEAYLPLDPQNYRAKFNLALAYSMTNRQPEAIREYQDLLKAQTDLLPARVNLGILLLESGDAAGALEQFQKVTGQQPGNWAAQINRAAALVALKRLPEARQAYQQALQIKPDDAKTHLAYAKILPPEEGAAAEEHLRRALALDPSLEEAQQLLAVLLETHADKEAEPAKTASLQEALGLYEKLLKAHPERTELRLHLSSIYLAQNRGADAIRELEAARAAGQPSYPLNYALLQAYLGAKQDDRALALIPEMLAQDNKNAELYLTAGSLHMENHQYELAAEAFEHATALDPQAPEGYKNLAAARYLLKDYSGTVAALEHVAALGKDTAGTYFLRAIALENLGGKAEALENYKRFLATDEQKNANQEWQAQQRIKVLEREVKH